MPKLCFVSGPKTVHCVRADCASRKTYIPLHEDSTCLIHKNIKSAYQGMVKNSSLSCIDIHVFAPTAIRPFQGQDLLVYRVVEPSSA